MYCCPCKVANPWVPFLSLSHEPSLQPTGRPKKLGMFLSDLLSSWLVCDSVKLTLVASVSGGSENKDLDRLAGYRLCGCSYVAVVIFLVF